jgi:hypothetical protein
MKRAYFACLFLCLTTTILFSQSNPVPSMNPSAKVASPVSASQADPKAQAKILDSYGKLPLSFEVNHGQADARVKFLSRTGGYSLFLTGDETVLALRGKKAKNIAPKRTISSPVETRPAAPEQPAEKFRFVSGHRFSDAASSAKSEAPSGAGHRPATDRTPGTVLRMKLRHANPAAKVTGVDELPGTSNYFIGNDPTKWRTNVPTYAKVKYEGIYSGIDLVYYGNQRQLEYDFIVAPGADPRRIAFDVSGAKQIRRDACGDLVLKMSEGEIRWHKPVAYQDKDGTRQEIAAHYAITDKNRVAFELAKYDASRPLYIDPLIYSTYLGGNGSEVYSLYGLGGSIAVDSAGNAYVTGLTDSTDFPTMNPLQPTNRSYYGTAFVSKINPSGSALVYSTYLGGSAQDYGTGIAVDSTGNAYVTGYTSSTDFPTMNPLQPVYGGGNGDAFVAKINPKGSALVYSTYLGGSGGDSGGAIAVDSVGDAYVFGYTSSTNFPVTSGAFQTVCNGGSNCSTFGDAFVTKLNPEGSAMVYSTYLGGSSWDSAFSLGGIAVDSTGNAYVTGTTYSTDFPVTPGAFQTVCGDPACALGDAFVTKLNPTGSALVYSTYLGGIRQDSGGGIAVDSTGNAYVTGSTYSTNFPVTSGAFQIVCNGGSNCSTFGDAFVTKLNPTGSALIYSTYLGGSRFDLGFGVAVDSVGSAYVTGATASRNFPTESPFRKHYGGGQLDAFVSRLNPAGSALIYSTYLGGSAQDSGLGIAVESAGNAYVTGGTYSTDFPVTPGAFQTVCNDGYSCGAYGDAFVAKLQMLAVTTITLESSPNPSAYGQAVTFTAAVTSGLGAPPNGETITFMIVKTVLGTGSLSGGSASITTLTLPVGTNPITAVYGGDSNLAGSTSKVVKQVVNKATTTTTLASSLNPSKVGQPVTFTASVTPQFSGKITGTMTFYDGTTALKTVSLSGGVAEFTTSKLTSGTHTITATYSGSGNFTGSSASLTQTVD